MWLLEGNASGCRNIAQALQWECALCLTIMGGPRGPGRAGEQERGRRCSQGDNTDFQVLECNLLSTSEVREWRSDRSWLKG